MRILFFTNEYSHEKLPSCGGVGTFLKVLVEDLNKKGHDVFVYGFSSKNIQFIDNGITFLFIKKYSKSHFFKEFVRSFGKKINNDILQLYFLKKERKHLAYKLKKYSNEHKIDIIESFAFGGYTAYWDNSIPLILRFHGSRGFWHYYLGQKKDSLKILMEQKALDNTSHIAAVSNFSAEAIQKIYNVNTQKVIYNGINTTVFSPDEKTIKINQSIFYFGTLSAAKGLDKLVNVFNTIIEKFPNSSLHLIGRGSDYWEHTIKKTLTPIALKSTTYYGAKQVYELPKLLNKATLICLPTKGENFPFSFLEAMALEKPVILSEIPVTKEIITHQKNGLIANTKEDFVSQISYVFNNPEKAHELAINARKHIVKNFTQKRMVENTITYYENILNN